MKLLVLFNLLLLFPWCSFSQKVAKPAIKVYVKDAETGKNVADAKVMLEGYEIPPVEGYYNKKGKCYYFDEIPPGYNTAMVYHEKYNEKGFQAINGLPKTLTLNVQDYRYVSYRFEEPVLKSIRKNYLIRNRYLNTLYDSLRQQDSIKHKNFRYLYNEDPYHIAIISKLSTKDFFSNDSINNLLNQLSLAQTIYVNGRPGSYMFSCYGFVDNSFYNGQYSVSSNNYNCDLYRSKFGYNIYFFHKKNKTKFSRYHCKEIQALRQLNLNVAVLTNRVIEYYANSPFNPASFDLRYKNISQFNLQQGSIDTFEFGRLKMPEQIFFKSAAQENKMYFGKNKFRQFEDTDDYRSSNTLFFIISKNTDSDTGLGILDTNTNTAGDNKNFYFFNSTYGIPLESIKQSDKH